MMFTHTHQKREAQTSLTSSFFWLLITMMCQTVRIVFQKLLKFLSNRSQNAKFAWVQNGIGKNVLDSEKFFSLIIIPLICSLIHLAH